MFVPVSIQDDLGSALSDFSNSFLAAGEDPLLILDDEWRLDVAIALATMDLVAEQIRDLDPPAGTEELHEVQLQIADELEITTAATVRGIDELDVAAIEEGTAALLRASALLDEATAILERFCE